LDYIKACDQQFTLTTKKSLHITFKAYMECAATFDVLTSLYWTGVWKNSKTCT